MLVQYSFKISSNPKGGSVCRRGYRLNENWTLALCLLSVNVWLVYSCPEVFSRTRSRQLKEICEKFTLTDTMGVFKYSPLYFLWTCMGLLFLLVDIGLDIWASVTFYQEKAYMCLCILLLFLLGSSVLVQAFSWLWYSYEDFERETRVEKCLSERQLKLLHFLQLGIYFRLYAIIFLCLSKVLQAVFLSVVLSTVLECRGKNKPVVALSRVPLYLFAPPAHSWKWKLQTRAVCVCNLSVQ